MKISEKRIIPIQRLYLERSKYVYKVKSEDVLYSLIKGI